MSKNTEFSKTIMVTIGLSIFTSFVAFLIQNKANHSVISCSYLDPISIDICASAFAIFLIIEGFFDIFRHKQSSLRSQFTRSVRVCLGAAIFTIHLMQFIHK